MFSLGSQSTWDMLFASVVVVTWLSCLLMVYVTYLVSRHFNVSKMTIIPYAIEIIAAVVASVFILQPMINFHMYSTSSQSVTVIYLLLTFAVAAIIVGMVKLISTGLRDK